MTTKSTPRPAIRPSIRPHVRFGAFTALVGIASLGLAAAPASAASACATDCISTVSTTTAPQSATLSITTTGGARVSATASATGLPSVYTQEPAGAPFALTHTLTFPSTLKQNTDYTVTIQAKDPLGVAWTETRKIRTLARTAHSVLTRIDLIDDSDAVGAGEFWGAAKFDTTVKSPLWGQSTVSKSSGGYWTLTSDPTRTTHIQTSAPDNYKVFVELADDDRDPGDMCGTGGYAPSFPSTFSNTCADISTAGTSVALPTAIGTTSTNFSTTTQKNAVVKFKISGFITTSVFTIPSIPTNVSAAAGSNSAFVTWNAPLSNGNATVTGYRVTQYPGGKTYTTANRTLFVGGLTRGATYTFRVQAINAAGLSPLSLSTNPIVAL